MATQPARSVEYILAAVRSGLQMSLSDALDHETALFGLVTGTEDMREGTRAFLEKRRRDVHGPVKDTPGSTAGTIDGASLSVAVVVSTYHEAITSALERGAREALREIGVPPEAIRVVPVPGAFEIPYVARQPPRRVVRRGGVSRLHHPG